METLIICLFLCHLLWLCFSVCPLSFPDLDKMDSEKDEMNQTDIAALHHFYSRHISDLPDDQALTELFAQVKKTRQLTIVISIEQCLPNYILFKTSCSNKDPGSWVCFSYCRVIGHESLKGFGWQTDRCWPLLGCERTCTVAKYTKNI